MAALDRLGAGALAHGGLGGAVVEAVVVLAVLTLAAAVWLRRRGKDVDADDDLRRDA